MYVFAHEAIYQTEINIYFNNQHVLINKSHNINTGVQSSNTYNCDHKAKMHLKARWKIFTSFVNP